VGNVDLSIVVVVADFSSDVYADWTRWSVATTGVVADFSSDVREDAVELPLVCYRGESVTTDVAGLTLMAPIHRGWHGRDTCTSSGGPGGFVAKSYGPTAIRTRWLP
jgi:hypothetical protein